MLKDVASQLRARGKGAEADEVLRSAKPLWSGTMVYRTIIPTEEVQRRFPNHRVLSQAHVVRRTSAFLVFACVII
jgi:salicylate hydroxylase